MPPTAGPAATPPDSAVQLPDDFRPRFPFPYGANWEVTPDNAERWNSYDWLYQTLCALVDHPAIDITCDEVALLRQDLIIWRSWSNAERTHHGPHLEDYLLRGREEWGELARELRRLQQLRCRLEEQRRQEREAKLQEHRAKAWEAHQAKLRPSRRKAVPR